jgi:hypothetical protein
VPRRGVWEAGAGFVGCFFCSVRLVGVSGTTLGSMSALALTTTIGLQEGIHTADTGIFVTRRHGRGRRMRHPGLGTCLELLRSHGARHLPARDSQKKVGTEGSWIPAIRLIVKEGVGDDGGHQRRAMTEQKEKVVDIQQPMSLALPAGAFSSKRTHQPAQEKEPRSCRRWARVFDRQ